MTLPTITLEFVQRALDLPDFNTEIAWQRMEVRSGEGITFPRTIEPDESTRRAGVLALLYPLPQNGTLTTVLIRRTPDPGVHSGQVAFPGGSWEKGDADFTGTALREACEEIGVCQDVKILGHLTPLYIPPSNFLVYPSVGALSQHPVWKPDPEEVAEVLELSLPDLLDDSRKREEDWLLHGHPFRVPFYSVEGHAVWGATALMLSELEGRLRAVLKDSA